MVIPQQLLSPLISLSSCLLGNMCWHQEDVTKPAISPSSTKPIELFDLELSTPPDYPRPYFIRGSSPAHSVATGNQIFRFPVTANSSGGEFTIVGTNAPPSKNLVVHPHLHKKHYENFFTVKGRIHQWTQSEGDAKQQGRIMTQHDFGSCPPNHTLQVIDHDTELFGTVFPGGFEKLFYFVGDNYDPPNFAPYDPSLGEEPNRGINDTVLEGLKAFDVWVQPDFMPWRDFVDGRRPANEVWHDGFNGVGNNSETGYFVANGHGPKYLNRNITGFYQVVQPLISPAASGDFNFTESLISINGGLGPNQPEDVSYEFGFGNSFTVLEGRLSVSVEGYKPAELCIGDTIYVSKHSHFSYHSNAHFTKVIYVGVSHEGNHTILIRNGAYVGSPMFPADQTSRRDISDVSTEVTASGTPMLAT